MSAPDANGWMRIETAPRDGTEILVFVDDHRNPEYRNCVAWFSQHKDGTAKWLVFATDESVFAISQPLSHWQPLPKPPVTP